MIDSLIIEEARAAAKLHRRKARWTSPRIMSGHPVAHADEDESQVKNFSTITKVVTMANGEKVFLIYRYMFSWIHSIFDNVQRWGSGRPSTKPFRRSTWQRSFAQKSRIDVIPVSVRGVVAMPYLPNYNLHDVLHNNIGQLPEQAIMDALQDLCRQISRMHDARRSWGELIVHNIILRKPALTPVICDTEVEYWNSVPFEVQCMHDWRDFIFSVCGSNRTLPLGQDKLAAVLVSFIGSQHVKKLLQSYCAKPRTLGQKIFWQGFAGSLSLPSAAVYDLIRQGVMGAA